MVWCGVVWHVMVWCGVDSKVYGVEDTIIITAFVLYCIAVAWVSRGVILCKKAEDLPLV